MITNTDQDASILTGRNSFRNKPRYRMLQRARQRAAKKGIDCTLKIQDIPNTPSTCPLLGIPLDRTTPDNVPSLDRIDNNKGYVPGNVHIISKRANTIKSDATPGELMKIGLTMLKIIRSLH